MPKRRSWLAAAFIDAEHPRCISGLRAKPRVDVDNFAGVVSRTTESRRWSCGSADSLGSLTSCGGLVAALVSDASWKGKWAIRIWELQASADGAWLRKLTVSFRSRGLFASLYQPSSRKDRRDVRNPELQRVGGAEFYGVDARDIRAFRCDHGM